MECKCSGTEKGWISACGLHHKWAQTREENARRWERKRTMEAAVLVMRDVVELAGNASLKRAGLALVAQYEAQIPKDEA